jgi:hypothetical protein
MGASADAEFLACAEKIASARNFDKCHSSWVAIAIGIDHVKVGSAVE